MKNVLLAASLLLVGCKDSPLNDPASQVAGLYRVTTYVVDSDTLISDKIGNISSYPNLFILVSRKDDSKVQVIYTTDPNGSQGGTGFNDITLREDSNKYNLISLQNTIDTYFGYTDGKTFYTDGAGRDFKKNKVIRTIIVGER